MIMKLGLWKVFKKQSERQVMAEKTETQDVLDLGLSQLVDTAVGDAATDEEWDTASDLLFDVISDLVDDEEIPDVPGEDENDETKQTWLDESLPKIEQS